MTGEFSRPATLDDLKSLVRSLNEHGVDYLLIGGYALYAHGYHRGYYGGGYYACGINPVPLSGVFYPPYSC